MSHSKTSLFLMELIIAILFFALSSAVCIRLFVKSHDISNHARSLTSSAMWCENVVEIFRATEGNSQHIVNILQENDHAYVEYQSVDSSESTITLYFDSNWNLLQSMDDLEHSKYIIRALIYENEGMMTCDISSSGSGKEIYHLTVNHFIKQ